jgi:RNA polymerase sigma-70 factor (ECF subfamily)
MQTGGHDAAAFRTTRWSRVARAAAPAHPGAPTALAEMCHDYWPPLYAFARRMGRSPQDAEDLTQSFFAALIEKNTLAAAEQARGKLRTFLLAAFQHHIADVAKREHALKRGGGAETLSINAVKPVERAARAARNSSRNCWRQRRNGLERRTTGLNGETEEAKAQM